MTTERTYTRNDIDTALYVARARALMEVVAETLNKLEEMNSDLTAMGDEPVKLLGRDEICVPMITVVRKNHRWSVAN